MPLLLLKLPADVHTKLAAFVRANDAARFCFAGKEAYKAFGLQAVARLFVCDARRVENRRRAQWTKCGEAPGDVRPRLPRVQGFSDGRRDV